MSLTPDQITARSEHTGLANAGEMGSEYKPCARAARVQFFYDDPLNTPITDLEIRLADASGAILIDGVKTEAPASRGAEDAAPGTGELRASLGGVRHGDVPVAAGALTAQTNPSQNIPAVIEDAWRIEQDIVAALGTFEISMKGKFQHYVDEWQKDGMIGAAADLGEGVMRGIGKWWDGEKDFWGTAWGALKSSVASIDAYIGQANEEGLPWWIPGASAVNLAGKLGRDLGSGIVAFFNDEGVVEFLSDLGEVMRGFLAGDIDRIIRGLQNLTGIEDLAGTLGEFGTMIREALADGVDWMRDMVEVLRRTPVLNLMVNTAMRCLLLMTPNFWAGVLGEGVGFIIPELLIWLITTIIAALSAGAGATILAARCLRIASSLRNAIRGSHHVAKILSFLDEIKPIFDMIGDLAKKLRESIEEVGERIMDQAHRVVRSSRYWRQRLDELARQGHGPQRHEGDVTDRQLLDRSLLGYDPMTGSEVDFDKFRKKYGVAYDPAAHGTPPDFGGRRINLPGKGDMPLTMSNAIRHANGAHATKINTPADYVRAYDRLVDDPRFKSFASGTDPRLIIDDLSASDVFGSGFQARFKGYDAAGNPTVFGPNTKIVGVFKKNDSGAPQLVTLYPNP